MLEVIVTAFTVFTALAGMVFNFKLLGVQGTFEMHAKILMVQAGVPYGKLMIAIGILFQVALVVLAVVGGWNTLATVLTVMIVLFYALTAVGYIQLKQNAQLN